MLKAINQSLLQSVIVILLFSFSAWWFLLHLNNNSNEIQNQLFAASYGVVALLGAIVGIVNSISWGGARSLIGRAILMLSLGLLAQEFGQLSYSYYIFYQHIEVPYPSIGDIGYFGSIFFYIYGIWLMGQAAGVKFSLTEIKHKIQAVLIPTCILAVSYFIFLQGYKFDWSSPLTILLDFGYPLGQAIYISLALLTYLLSRGVLGGIMKYRVLMIVLALFVQYLADFTFLYQAANGTWFAGGINDYMYLIAYFVMTLSLLQLNVKSLRSKLD